MPRPALNLRAELTVSVASAFVLAAVIGAERQYRQRAARRRRGYVLTGAFAADMVGNSFFVGMADEEHSEIAAIAGSDRRGFGLPRSRRNGLSGGVALVF